jgi:uncharacterized protein
VSQLSSPASGPEMPPVPTQDAPAVAANPPPEAGKVTPPEPVAPTLGDPAPQVASDAPPPQKAGADTTGAAPTVPLAADAPAVQPLPSVSAGPEADAPAVMAPAPAEPPATPPTDAPADAPATAGQITPPTAPNAGDVPAATSQSPAPDLPMAEAAPQPAELPPPPPLTPEEEALLQPMPREAANPAPETNPAPSDPTPEPRALPDPDTEIAMELPPPSTLRPAPELGDQNTGVVTGRLPRIGAAPAPADEAQTDDATLIPAEDVPPLQRYARPFSNEAQKPLFAILLVDNGGEDVNRAELAALEIPISVVIDPLAEDAAERAAIWRAGGQEVVMAGTGIPAGAGPGDLEQSFQVLDAKLPEAVAVIDADGSAFQNNRPLATQVVPILAGQGRGLVTLDQGLNAADQVARREKLPATTIFRRIDPAGEGSPVIRRYLDRAAFKAAQDGRVVVIGDLRPETVAGILEWAVEGRASTVALAPISALLAN